MEARLKYNRSIAETLDKKEFLHILYGGSASGKSYGIAQYYIEAVLYENRNILALRKVGSTIRNSIFALFRQLISKYELNEYFIVNKAEFSFTTQEGYKIICSGLDDPEKIKSITTEKGIITDIWLEEATEFLEEDFNQLLLRLRGKSDVKKRIRMTFNPISQLHWIKRRFFDVPQDDVFIKKFLYKDNVFLEREDIQRIESMKDADKVYYEVYALGNWGVLGNLVFNNWEVKDLTDIKHELNEYLYGLDFGFTNDPTAIIKIGYHNNTIYILDEYYKHGMMNDEIAKVCKDFVNGYVMCDSAEPKSIAELRNYGVNALSVKKGKDSVMHGIQWIRQKKILIDKGCQNFINEIQTYKYKETKDGIVMNQPIDMNNHLLDSLRYSLNNYISQKIMPMPTISAGSLGL